MAINFPTSLDVLANPTTSNPLNSPSHAGQHSDENDALEALETKVGINGSADTNSLDYKVANKQNHSTALDNVSGVNTADETNGRIGAIINAAGGISQSDTDYFPTVVSSVIYKITWTSIKAFLKTYFDTLYATIASVPVKATGAEIDTGTDDAKFATPKAIADAAITHNEKTQTLINKRINPRLVTATSYTTDTGTSLDISTCDQFEVTAQAGALLFNAPGGTPLGGQKLVIRIKDNGTARALTYNAIFRAMGNALPTTTVLSKTLYMGFIYNATDSKWDLVAVAQEA